MVSSALVSCLTLVLVSLTLVLRCRKQVLIRGIKLVRVRHINIITQMRSISVTTRINSALVCKIIISVLHRRINVTLVSRVTITLSSCRIRILSCIHIFCMLRSYIIFISVFWFWSSFGIFIKFVTFTFFSFTFILVIFFFRLNFDTPTKKVIPRFSYHVYHFFSTKYGQSDKKILISLFGWGYRNLT